jgi:tetratricopeptide (TPR) repeat protein
LPLAVRSLAHLANGNVSSAQDDARRARWLDPDNPTVARIVTRTHGYVASLVQAGPIPVKAGKGLVVGSNSKEAALLRGSVLLSIGQSLAARKELQKAIGLDPSFAPAYARLALLEEGQGFPIQAKKLALKTYELDDQLAETKSVLALCELRLRHLAHAEKLAREVVGKPYADLEAKLMAYMVLVGVAVKRGDWKKAQEALRQADDSLPSLSLTPLWLHAAEQAHEDGQMGLVAEYLARAERLEPRSPLIMAARKHLQQPSAPSLPLGIASPPVAVAETDRASYAHSRWAVAEVLLVCLAIASVLVMLIVRRRRHFT